VTAQRPGCLDGGLAADVQRFGHTARTLEIEVTP
jgi:hypothetical protein